MATADIARTVFGILGNITAGFLFLSPLPTFVRICKKRSVEQYSAAPYLATLVNCMVWTLYGLPIVHPNSLLVVTINGAGCVIEIIYVILFFVFSDGKKKLKLFMWLLVELIFMAALTLCTLILAHTHKKRSAIVGTICIVFNIMMYASPLSIMKLVITTKSVEYMPFFLSLAAFANGLAWTTYAFMHFDPFLVVPNGLGTLLGAAQLILYATYYKSTKRIMAARKAKAEMDVTESEMVLGSQDPNRMPDALPTPSIVVAPHN